MAGRRSVVLSVGSCLLASQVAGCVTSGVRSGSADDSDGKTTWDAGTVVDDTVTEETAYSIDLAAGSVLDVDVDVSLGAVTLSLSHRPDGAELVRIRSISDAYHDRFAVETAGPHRLAFDEIPPGTSAAVSVVVERPDS